MDNLKNLIRQNYGFITESNENELRDEFIRQFAAGDGSEEDIGGSVADRSLDLTMQQGEELPPLQEGEDIKQAHEAPDNEIAEAVDWTNFSIDRSQNFA